MLIRTDISLEPKDASDILVKKMFTVVVITDYYPKKNSNIFPKTTANVHIYDCVIFSSSHWRSNLPQITINQQVDGKYPDRRTDKSEDFFSDVDHLRMFWGKETRRIEGVMEFYEEILGNLRRNNIQFDASCSRLLEVTYTKLEKDRLYPITISQAKR